MTFLVGYWRYIAVAAIVASLLGYTYHAGGDSSRAELAALKAASVVLQHQHEALIKGNDDDYRKSLADRDAYWRDWMQQHPAKPTVKVVAGVCQDSAGNAAVSAAVSDYLDTIGRVRGEIEGIVKSCDAQQEQLVCVVDYAQKDAVIH